MIGYAYESRVKPGGGKWAAHVRIEGLEAAIIQFHVLRWCYGFRGEKLEDLLFKGAEMIKARVQVNAPYDPERKKGKHLREGVHTGRITRGKGAPGAFVAMHYRWTPHAHFTEFGTVHIEPQYWFRRSVDEETAAILDMLAEGAKRKLLRAAERKAA